MINTNLLRSIILEKAYKGLLKTPNPLEAPFILEKAELLETGYYSTPDNWRWYSISDLTTKLVDGDHNPPKEADFNSEYKMLSAVNIDKNRITNLENARSLTKENFKNSEKRTSLSVGDILLTIVGTIGRSCVYTDASHKYSFQRSVSVITPIIDSYYLKYYFDSPYIQNLMNKNAKGTAQKGFYLNQLKTLLVPLPPLEEQKRIVAKIEELFAIIDEIDKAQKELKELAELAEKKVLDMAVRGELVEQDASEGTAADILNQIREDYKTRKTNKWQKSSLSHKIGSFNIPASWQWTSIEEIVDGIIIGKDKPKDCSEIKTKDKQIPVVANGIQNDGIVGYTSMSSLSTGKVVTVAGRGSIGYPIVRNYPFYPIVRLIVLKPNRNIDCDYLSLVLFCLREEGSGTAINQLTAPMIREKQIPLPPLLEQKRISNIYNRFKYFKTRLTD